VKCHSQAQAIDRSEVIFGQRYLCVDGCLRSLRCGRESHAERVTHCLEDKPAMPRHSIVDDLFLTGNSGFHRLAVLLPALRAAFNVGKEKCDRASR
jgi:hypothetical protein